MTGPSPTRMRQTRRWRDYTVLAALIVFVVGGLVALAAATGWEETLSQIAGLTWAQVALLLGLSLFNYVARGLRWHLFATKLVSTTQLLQNMRHFLGGLAMSVTPGRLGELVRMRWLSRETGVGFDKSAPLMLADRSSDLSAMGLLLALAIAASATGIAGAVPVAILALVAAFVATRAELVISLGGLGYRILGRFPRLFARLRRAGRAIAQFSTPRVLILATLIGSAGWLAEGIAFWMLLHWMGTDMVLSTAVAIFVFSTLAGGLTGAPGGVGGAEAAMVALLSLEGVPLETSLPATAIIRLTTLWFAIVIGLLVFPIAERQSLKVRDALENH